MTASPSPTPVSLITHVDALPVGTRLAEFEVLGLLGAGGFGMVYQAFDHSLQRPVAIKEFMPATLACRGPDGAVVVRDPADQAAFQAGLQSFVVEAQLLAQFDHPSLVKVFRYWEAHRTAYMVMPLYRGITLQAARSQMRSPPTEAWLRKVLWAVLGALKTLHQGRAVHRDVSPDNIFLQDIGPPVLLDLGAARHAMGGKTQDLTDAFKLSYAPLEQHAGAPDMRQGPWTDLYALAAVVHGLLCNKPPLPATFRAVRDRLPPFARVARTVQEQFGLGYSQPFVQAVSQALAIDARDRPQSVGALVQLMALETPNGMSRFDWRAELGPIWAPPGLSGPPPAARVESPAPQPPAPAPRNDPTQPLAAAPRRRDVVTPRPAVSAPGTAVAASVRSGLSWRVGAGVVAVAVVALLLGLMLGRDARPPETRLAQAPAAAAPVQRVASPPPATLVEPVAVLAAPVQQVAAVARAPLLPEQRPTPAAKRLPAKKTVAPADAANPPSPTVPPLVAAVAPERVEVPQRAKSPDPLALCADSNFVSRPMCIFRQCQKPEMAKLPLCVENNARLQNSRRADGF
ncbi:MAG: protein kinase [Polaromonas sp.]|uniref:serine/threonine protein kinase n=1 Tax=Polaromonas sp. TaxID=1869339 RepID=UPI002731F935|nr:serine/threonine protein kinase [Polaromonas sp.]MDP2449337.1 protein kinase [Polaromonas sp.]MDP3246936.1 protein kinase [Polaromonas sp.]MDP3755770.1 protein kinase [Polaromonas sp.]